MTIQELIETLSNFDPDWLVVIAGYRSGYNDVIKVKPVKIQLNVNPQWYCGAYTLARPNCPDATKHHAIYLGGYNPNVPTDLTDQYAP